MFSNDTSDPLIVQLSETALVLSLGPISLLGLPISNLKITPLLTCRSCSFLPRRTLRESHPRYRSLLPGIPAGELTNPVGLICITVTSSFELVVVILQRERDANMLEKQRRTEVPLASVPPLKCIAGGSSDTHNNHNNGISRVTRGPPPRIVPPHVPPLLPLLYWLYYQAGESSRRVVFPRLYSGATTQPDCGPSGFRSEFSRRAPTAQRARPRCQARTARGEEWIACLLRDTESAARAGSSLAVLIVERRKNFTPKLEEELELKDSWRRSNRAGNTWRLLRKHRTSRRAAK